MKYKKSHRVVFPPFKYFVEIDHKLAQVKNDPSFHYERSQTNTSSQREQHKGKFNSKDHVNTTNKTNAYENNADEAKPCPIHGTNHSLNDCKTLRSKLLTDRKQ
jgi:hypothetical protein